VESRLGTMQPSSLGMDVCTPGQHQMTCGPGHFRTVVSNVCFCVLPAVCAFELPPDSGSS
jgi:hypothetical protein